MVRQRALVLAVMMCAMLIAVPAFSQKPNQTIVLHPTAFAESQALRDLPIDMSIFANQEMPEPRPIPNRSYSGAFPQAADPALQTEVLPAVSANLGVVFDGIPAQNYAPSDANLAVGPNHVVETVNVRLAVYSKTGVLLSGPTNFTTFFSALANNCATGASDPIVNYDRQADRWVISDIGYTGAAPFLQCYAVSKTNDPTGAYYLYSFSFGTTLNDYPKVSVWPTASNSAYLSTYNLFAPGGFAGAGLCGFDRTKALAGDKTATQLCQQTPSNDCCYLPSDNDGPTPPADGTPGLFITWFNNNPGQLYLRKLTLNFSAGTAVLSSPTTINVTNFTPACFSSCVPQSQTTQLLDALGDRSMYRFPVRHFADHDRAVLNHSVVNGSSIAVRWYELYDPAGTVTLNQQGTFAPDSTYRWMGSMAEDKNADIAVGYSASSSSIHPAIRFTGRVPGDPAGTLETEASILAGGGSQLSGLSRWGDYTALQVDPSDDCTFWYVDQYEKTNGTFNWSTSIASFAFSGCGGGGSPAVTLSATKLNFGKVVLGQTSAAKSVTLTNSGTATLNISNIAATGDFTITNNSCGAQVVAGGTCKVTLTFSPTAIKSRKGTLSFTDDAAGSPQTVALVGTGTQISLNPTSLAFGSVTVGQTSPSQNIVITNVGSTTVTFTSFGFSGTAAGDYLITNNTCGATIAGGANCTVSIAFKPTVTGKRNANFVVKDNGGGGSQTAKLTGKGV